MAPSTDNESTYTDGGNPNKRLRRLTFATGSSRRRPPDAAAADAAVAAVAMRRCERSRKAASAEGDAALLVLDHVQERVLLVEVLEDLRGQVAKERLGVQPRPEEDVPAQDKSSRQGKFEKNDSLLRVTSRWPNVGVSCASGAPRSSAPARQLGAKSQGQVQGLAAT
eukprot:gene11629-8283_t